MVYGIENITVYGIRNITVYGTWNILHMEYSTHNTYWNIRKYLLEPEEIKILKIYHQTCLYLQHHFSVTYNQVD